jgi:hypothetical protein
MAAPKRREFCPISTEDAITIIGDIKDLIDDCEQFAEDEELEPGNLLIKGKIIIDYYDRDGNRRKKEIKFPPDVLRDINDGVIDDGALRDLIDRGIRQVPNSGRGIRIRFEVECRPRSGYIGSPANTPYRWGETEPILIVNPDDVDLRGPPFGPFGGPFPGFGDVL